MKALLILCLFAITACASTQIYHQQLVNLSKGMTIPETATSLQRTPLSTHTTTVGDKAYSFQRYYLNNGLNSDVYLLCFENRAEDKAAGTGKLKYWGYIEEFRRYPDARINKALENVLPEIRASMK